MDSVGGRLKEERQRLGLSQTAFGEIGGVRKGAQINYEADERSPDANYLAAVAAAGADIRYIVTGEREGPPPPPALAADEETLLDGYRALDAATRRRVLAFVFGGEPPSPARVRIGGSVGQVVDGDVRQRAVKIKVGKTK